MMHPLITSPGVPELILILLVVVLLFGAKKLPDLARGSGRALRIFKAETKGLMDDDDDVDAAKKSPEQLEIDAAAAREAEQRRAREEHNGPTGV